MKTAISILLTLTLLAMPLAAQRFNPNNLQTAPLEPKIQLNVMQAIRPEQQKHINVLKRFGITDLKTLGKMTLSGNVVVQKGMLTPDLVAAAIPTTVSAATKRQNQSFVPLTGPAKLMPVRNLGRTVAVAAPGNARLTTTSTLTNDVPIDAAYIAAAWLDVPANTNIILRGKTKRLFLIVENITFGANVTFTYEREVPASLPSTPAKPGKPATPPVPANFSTGLTGTAGTNGSAGAKGPGPFDEAPRAELWVLTMAGSPAVDFRGQDGYGGGKGGDGGDGGDGGQGSASISGTFDCKRGPGAGGNGAKGGRAGDGGAGGDGATGGELKLYAPQSVISAFSGGFYISVDPGQPGSGGIPGVPGAPGSGGGLGALSARCGTHGRGPGGSGTQGDPGVQGAAGKPGAKSSNTPVQFTAITPAEFAVAWLKPAIKTLTAKTSTGGKALEGETVSAVGLYFAPGDTIEIGGGAQWTVCPTTILGDTLLSFVVPVVQGGLRSVRLRRPNGTLSNEASLYISATLTGTNPTPRLTPGETAKLFGTGFTTGMRVRINNFEIGPATYQDPHTMEFMVIRPTAGIPLNPAGEPVKLVADLSGTITNALDVVLDTFLIADGGDSILGGPGLDEKDRIVTVVAKAFQAQPGNRQVYVRSLSHTGAKIGITPSDSPGLAGVDRQVPTRYPTVREQMLTLAGAPDLDPKYTDLIILCAGANDVGIDTWINPNKTAADIIPLVEQASHLDMVTLLNIVAAKFPNARVVVAGNYAPLGPASNDVKLVPMLDAFRSVWYNIFPNVLTVLSPAAKQQIISNCQTFTSEANKRLALSVSEINTSLGGKPRFFFADPKFGPMNAAESGPDSWVYGIDTLQNGAVLKPQDSPEVAAARAAACDAVGSPRTDVAFCKRASAGHPNRVGAKRYADAIVAALP